MMWLASRVNEVSNKSVAFDSARTALSVHSNAIPPQSMAIASAPQASVDHTMNGFGVISFIGAPASCYPRCSIRVFARVATMVHV